MGLVLLIACVNVACLELVRAVARQKELVVRAALGAGRRRLARQLFTESALLAAFGGLMGLLVGFGGVRLLRALRPQQIPHLDMIGIDGRVIVFTVVAAVATGLLFGLAPALSSSRLDLSDGLKGSSSSGTGNRRLRSALVVAELALASILLIGAGLLIRTFIHLATVDPGFDAHRLLTLQIELPEKQYQNHPQQTAFSQRLLDHVRALPGVKFADIGSGIPPEGSMYLVGTGVDGRPLPPRGLRPDIPYDTVSPGYFHTLGVPLKAGRGFTESDGSRAAPVAIVNEGFAHRFFPGQNPIGKRVFTGVWREIVGVVGNVSQRGPLHPSSPEAYAPYLQDPSATMVLLVRTATNPLALAGEIRKAVAAVDKHLVVYNMATIKQRLVSSVAAQRFNMVLLGIFAALALVLAGVGIYGVVSYSANQRTHEFGVRMALGAQRKDVLRLLVWRGMALVVAGLLIGLSGAAAATRFLASLLYGVKPTDPLTFVVVSLVLIGVALLACYIPARRAMKVDPAVALRHE